jgi:4-hydroxybenzoate polyprenyltransferase
MQEIIETVTKPLPVPVTVPLCVDLDGTLVKSDMLWEGCWLAARTHPILLLKACLGLGSGRAQFKRKIAAIAIANPSLLPYRADLVTFISAEAKAGRTLILATAADEAIARSVAQHLGIFGAMLASNGALNCKGTVKLAAIQKISPQFIYVGDSTADLPIWKASNGAIVAGSDRAVLRLLQKSGIQIHNHFPSQRSLLQNIIRAIRVHQWPKNILVFLPIFLGHKTMDAAAWSRGMLMMAVFCVTASVAYLINDLVDLEADRQHSKKSKRPFAAGDLSIQIGLFLLVLLVLTAFCVSTFLLPGAQMWIAIYFVATLFYSFYLKTLLLADVVGLAMLYVLRVLAGGSATSIVISPWTLAFCLFFFYSLALMKRFGELKSLSADKDNAVRRGYGKADLSIVSQLGVASGILSAVVLAHYISSPEVRINYRSPDLLWLICPIILYWFGRLWILSNRGVVSEDPMLFSLRDKTSYMTGACIALIWLFASLG